MKRRGIKACLLPVAAALAALPLLAPPAGAATIEPTLTTTAWYWEDAQSRSEMIADNEVVLRTTNPYCPTTEGSAAQGGSAPNQTCNLGRLPVWVKNGEFDPPYMGSALEFDLTLVPQGATVSEFTLTLMEADCDPADRRKDTPHCQATTLPIEPEEHLIQVCEVTEIFGEGEAASYDESPDFTCGEKILGERKVLKAPVNKATGEPYHRDDHVWVFDLTPLAQKWVEEFTIPTAIWLQPEAPRAPKSSDNFRVVFGGPRDRPAKGGADATPVQQADPVQIELTYTGGESFSGDDFGDFGEVGTDAGGGFAATPSTTTTTGGDFGDTSLPSTGTATTDVAQEGTTGSAAEAAPAEQVPLEPVATEPVKTEPLPGYVWLAVLGGLAAFSVVRSLVIPQATGIRPDGVLAQITKLNAAKRGASAAMPATTAPSAFTAIKRGLGAAGRGARSAIGKASGVIGNLKRS